MIPVWKYLLWEVINKKHEIPFNVNAFNVSLLPQIIVNCAIFQASGCRGMILQDERIFCMCTINGNLVLAGTKKGNIVVFDAQSHDRLHTATGLGDSVLCLELYSNDNCYLVIAGLANGQLAIFEGRDFLEAGRPLYFY